MSTLFGTLTSAARALEAQRYGLDVTGQNIANVNTPGYARRAVDLAAVPPDSPRSAGRGVDVVGVRAMRDQLLERRLQQELPAERREAAIAEVLSLVEAALGRTGESVDRAMNAFFDAFANLSESPTSPVARQEVLLQGEGLATSFRDMRSRLDLARRDTDSKVRSAVEQVTELAGQIAAINQSIAAAGADRGGSLHLQDEQSELLRKLSEIIDVDVLQRPDGGVDVTFGNGRALVVGETAYTLGATTIGGVTAVTAGGVNVTAEISGGRLGGFLYARDVQIPAYVDRLDTLAYEFVSAVNTVHAANVGQDGGTGRDFFTFSPAIVGSDGAAGAIAVNAAVAADPRLVAAAGSSMPTGDNSGARALAALRHERVVGGTATLGDTWAQLVYRVGRDVQSAENAQKSRQELVAQVDALRDQVSGISLDEEAMHLLKFQRAYEANARFFRAVDMTLDTLMQALAR